jgi:hypothetical protein
MGGGGTEACGGRVAPVASLGGKGADGGNHHGRGAASTKPIRYCLFGID